MRQQEFRRYDQAVFRALILCAALVAACKQESGADPAEVETSGPAKGSAGGFSASLSAEMGGSGSAGSEAAGSGLSRTASGNAPKTETTEPAAGSGAGSAMTKTESAAGGGSGSGMTKTEPAAGSGAATKTEPASGSGSAASAAKTEPAKAGSGSGSAMVAKTEPVKTELVKTEPVKTEPAKAGSGAGSAMAAKTEPVKAPPAGSGSGSAAAAKVEPPKPVIAMTPELRAVKLSLLANWDRDVVAPGTISLFDKNSNTTFSFHYGYEVSTAPADRDAYKKYLADNKILTARIDRQSGAAWYLEGTDGAGRGVFRIVVTYGGKKLICYGSTYKESPLGDLRDTVVNDAKKICETIQL